ncbi:hypothetical protein [Paraburkholderia sp. MM6662-R1]|uniref:hypothetical protein n=1 Tax=Paraburkholderia sp. MM6662-R1 TaxID=2991066 RepID=UPI003D22E705
MSIGHPLSRPRGLSGAAARTAPTQLELTGGPSHYAPSEHPGARAERERIFAILNHPHAAAQPDTARELAFTPCLSPQAAATILAAKGQEFANRAAALWEKHGRAQEAESGAPAEMEPEQPASRCESAFSAHARALWNRHGAGQAATGGPAQDDD